MGTVRVGIVGIGNCASSLVQGVEFYRDAEPGAVGLTHPVCAGYAVGDVEFSAAFDVHTGKTGRDLSEAIWAAPNNSRAFAKVPHLGVPVTEGPLADGVGRGSADRLDVRGEASLDDVVRRLKESGTHVLVNFLPVGSQAASELYARAALDAGCAFLNCIPSVVARSPQWAERFAAAGLPLAGDDLKSQFGATLIHRALVDVLRRNGVALRSTYQLLGGGNMDFWNMQDAERMADKKATKAQGMFAGGTDTAGAAPGPGRRPAPSRRSTWEPTSSRCSATARWPSSAWRPRRSGAPRSTSTCGWRSTTRRARRGTSWTRCGISRPRWTAGWAAWWTRWRPR